MKNWYEQSIKSLIENYLKEAGYDFSFDETNYWDYNLSTWLKEVNESDKEHFITIANKARSYAFDQKYGCYSYEKDFRSVCPNWNNIILSEITQQLGKDLSNKSILALGSNNGSELAIIFENYLPSLSIDVVEISKQACDSGKKTFPSFNFICSSMDEVELYKSYDIFLSLRAAYCASNHLEIIAKKAYDSVKENGIIIFSISNGYIDYSSNKPTPIKGLYNPETMLCSNAETNQYIHWLKDAMLTSGCKNVKIVDAESEILLISSK